MKRSSIKLNRLKLRSEFVRSYNSTVYMSNLIVFNRESNLSLKICTVCAVPLSLVLDLPKVRVD